MCNGAEGTTSQMALQMFTVIEINEKSFSIIVKQAWLVAGGGVVMVALSEEAAGRRRV